MDEEEEVEVEYIEVDIEAEISKATTKIYDELTKMSDKMDRIKDQLRANDRRIEELEDQVKRSKSMMIEISADKVAEAIAKVYIERAVGPTLTVPRKTTVRTAKTP